MRTTPTRAAIALLGFLTLHGCARAVQQGAMQPLQGDRIEGDRSESLRFDNAGRDRVDIYLVGETRSWHVGRLAPGQARWLTLPRDVSPSDRARLQMVVLANASLSVDPRRAPRAVTTLLQPLGTLASQRWSFTQGQLSALRMDGAGTR